MRPNRVLVVVVGAILLVGVVAAVAFAVRPVGEFDRGTPEGTVQAYLEAILDHDYRGAIEYLDPSSRCDISDLNRTDFQQADRVVLRETWVEGDMAWVEVEIVFASQEGPFDTYEYSDDETFELTRDDDTWLLLDEPWPLYNCRRG